MDRFDTMRVFAKVAEIGSFAGAAARLDISPSMVSQHVKALEERLGARLLNRTTRKVGLTEIGREYYERCAQILTDFDEADRIASALQLTPRGRLRIFCDTNIARFIAPVVAHFLEDFPEVTIDLRTGNQMAGLVEEGFDLAIRAVVPPDSSLIVRRLVGWRHTLCCAPRYLENHPAPVCLADLAAHNCLRYAHYPFGDEWHFTDPDGKPATVRVSGNLLTSSAAIYRTILLNGGGLALVAPFIAEEEVRSGTLVSLLPEYRPVEFAINAIYPHRRYLAATVRTFIDMSAGRFVEHQRWLDPFGSKESSATRR
ncbi:LysR family transcriptional regulator [Acidisphaera sp. S103]|uniref:LysR family transcriptional regulator n=1 Tax=Acidisphaera sp. S103 TaxID=1747223 RepID=UPI00131D8E99|nr:LysR family transcriptional regulator [Acidisphaera sp. S103]